MNDHKRTVLECYSVKRSDTAPPGGERVEYVPLRYLSDDAERFFDERLDDALVNLTAAAVFTITGQPKEAETARAAADATLKNLNR